MKAIVELRHEAVRVLDGYEFQIAMLPPNFPYRDAPWEYDDRGINIPKNSGSLWFRICTVTDSAPVGQATFAADDTAVRCETITVDEDHRGKGIASHVYTCAACIFDAPVVPSGTLLDGGERFWRGRTSIEC